MNKHIQTCMRMLVAIACIIASQFLFAGSDSICRVLINKNHILSLVKPGMTVDQATAKLGPKFATPSYVDLRYQWMSSDPNNKKVYIFTAEDNNVVAELGDIEPTADEANAMNADERKFLFLLNQALDTNNFKKLPLADAAQLVPTMKPAGYSNVYTFPDIRVEFIILVFDTNNKLVTAGSNCENVIEEPPAGANSPSKPAASAPAATDATSAPSATDATSTSATTAPSSAQ